MTAKKNTIVLLCYARSGGTLFSQALASLPDTVLVSEVNPVLNAKGTIATQLKNWYDFEIAPEGFAQMAKEGFGICSKQNKNFIIRDYSFIDFTPHKLNSFRPANSFSTINALEGVLPVMPIAFLRNAFDVWISRGCPPEFSKYYLNYIKAILAHGAPIFRYEDFCENPEQTIQKVCEKTGIVFSEDFMQKSLSNQKITGDNDLKNPSRGNLLSTIQPLKRKRLPSFLVKMAEADLQLAEANKLLGYSENYLDAQFEEANNKLKLELKWFLKRILKKYPTDLY